MKRNIIKTNINVGQSACDSYLNANAIKVNYISNTKDLSHLLQMSVYQMFPRTKGHINLLTYCDTISLRIINNYGPKLSP